jgi:hypothetical protein
LEEKQVNAIKSARARQQINWVILICALLLNLGCYSLLNGSYIFPVSVVEVSRQPASSAGGAASLVLARRNPNATSLIDVDMRLRASATFTRTTIMPPGFVSGIDLSALEQNGFLAIRVPHAPPTYTTSNILTMNGAFVYYSPLNSAAPTFREITTVPRNEYLPTVNARFPVSDGHSHWEVWGLPAGGHLPVPTQSFYTTAGSDPLRLFFTMNMGAGVDANNCAGCDLEFQVYNGATFIGYKTKLNLAGASGNPLAKFDLCGTANTSFIALVPGATVTHTHCLSNLDSIAHTFNLTATSSRNWNYTLYSQALTPGAPLVPIVGNQITVSPGTTAQGMLIRAVASPPINSGDPGRETLFIQAISNSNSNAQDAVTSWVLGPAYTLNETPPNLFLPGIFLNLGAP